MRGRLRSRLRIVPNSLVHVAQLKVVQGALGQLADDPGRAAGDDGEARDDHGGRHDAAVEDLDVVLDNGELVDGAVAADGHVVADGGGLDDGVLADKDVVAQPEGHVGVDALVQAAGGAEEHAAREEAVAADGDGGGARGRRGRRGRGAHQVAADHDLGLDDRLAAEHDVLRAHEDGLAGDLVARVLCGGGAVSWRSWEGEGGGRGTVSM